MTPRPPRSTLFPYTTLLPIYQPSTQFGSFGVPAVAAVGVELDRKLAALLEALRVEVPMALLSRSEEHTSELQSRLHLVCRLLLEKKKRDLVVYPVRIRQQSLV